MSKPVVAIARTDSYDGDDVIKGIAECFNACKDTLPVFKGNVLLKPNMIFPKAPEACATTHPSVVKAVAEYISSEYSTDAILVGDSPGGIIGDIEKFWDKTGLKKAEAESCFSLVSFETGEMEERIIEACGTKASIKIAKPVLDADFVISLSKLKTHSFTLFTGALKNIYGIIPGLLKANYHKRFRHPFDFAEFIAAINKIFKPSFHLMDAVIGMEGEGPSAGTPRAIGCILASTDPVALDATAVTLIGIKPDKVPTIQLAAEAGLGVKDLEQIAYPLEHPEDMKIENFKFPDSSRIYARIPKFIYRILYSFFKTKPEMTHNCTQCMKCVKLCPVKAINLKDDLIKVDYKKCISCFCCHEMCEHNAIDLKASYLARKIIP